MKGKIMAMTHEKVLAGMTQDHEGETQLRSSTATDDEKVINTVEERLANLNDITNKVDDQADEPEEGDEPTPEEEEEKDGSQDDNQAGDDDDPGEPTPDEDDDGDKEGQEDKTLPSAFLRAAIHRGWKEEDANEFFKDNPDAALRTFQNCYMDVNNASREWARIGKAKQDAGSQQIDASDARPQLEKVDVDKLVKDYDLDDATAKQLREQQTAIDAMEQQPAAQPQQQQLPVDPNVTLEIDNFFNAELLGDYREFYGTLKLGQNWNDLGGGQYDNRFAVLQQADMILMGAEVGGQKMEPATALELAHMIVSEPIREQAIRESLKATAVKRKKGMTVRPSAGSRSSKKIAGDAGGKVGSRSKEELTVAVQEKMNTLFK